MIDPLREIINRMVLVYDCTVEIPEIIADPFLEELAKGVGTKV